MTFHDTRSRSRVVTDGIEATTSRGMLRALGIGEDDCDKPQSALQAPERRSPPANSPLPGSRRRPRKAFTQVVVIPTAI